MQRIRKLLSRWNEQGLNLPMVRDPRTGRGSVSLTLLFISSLWVQVSLVGKLVKILGGLDSESAIYWFLSCAALYFGRSISGNKSNASLSAPGLGPSKVEETVVNVNSNNTAIDNPDQ